MYNNGLVNSSNHTLLAHHVTICQHRMSNLLSFSLSFLTRQNTRAHKRFQEPDPATVIPTHLPTPLYSLVITAIKNDVDIHDVYEFSYLELCDCSYEFMRNVKEYQ